MTDTLGIQLKPEVLPFSNIPAFLPPFWLSRDKAMAVAAVSLVISAKPLSFYRFYQMIVGGHAWVGPIRPVNWSDFSVSRRSYPRRCASASPPARSSPPPACFCTCPGAVAGQQDLAGKHEILSRRRAQAPGMPAGFRRPAFARAQPGADQGEGARGPQDRQVERPKGRVADPLKSIFTASDLVTYTVSAFPRAAYRDRPARRPRAGFHPRLQQLVRRRGLPRDANRA